MQAVDRVAYPFGKLSVCAWTHYMDDIWTGWRVYGRLELDQVQEYFARRIHKKYCS